MVHGGTSVAQFRCVSLGKDRDREGREKVRIVVVEVVERRKSGMEWFQGGKNPMSLLCEREQGGRRRDRE